MRPRPTLDLHLSGDIDNLLRGLAMSANGMAPGEYRRGYTDALAAVGVAMGMEPRQRDEPEPLKPARVFDGIEDVPWAIGAFARMGS